MERSYFNLCSLSVGDIFYDLPNSSTRYKINEIAKDRVLCEKLDKTKNVQFYLPSGLPVCVDFKNSKILIKVSYCD